MSPWEVQLLDKRYQFSADMLLAQMTNKRYKLPLDYAFLPQGEDALNYMQGPALQIRGHPELLNYNIPDSIQGARQSSYYIPSLDMIHENTSMRLNDPTGEENRQKLIDPVTEKNNDCSENDNSPPYTQSIPDSAVKKVDSGSGSESNQSTGNASILLFGKLIHVQPIEGPSGSGGTDSKDNDPVSNNQITEGIPTTCFCLNMY